MTWIETYNQRLAPSSVFQYFNTWILTHLSEVRAYIPGFPGRSDIVVLQIIFTLRAMQNPTRLPEFMARLNLVQTSARGVAWSFSGVFSNRDLIKENLNVIRRTYEAEHIQNVVPDGTLPFQIEPAQATSGVALEFR